jgi:hypothetical protein
VAGLVPAKGQNLIDNGDFDASLGGWSEPPWFIEASWRGDFDANGSPTSGAAQLVNHEQAFGGIGQCFPVTAGATYQFGGSLHVPAIASELGTALIMFFWYRSVDCSGNDAGWDSLWIDPAVGPFDEWVARECSTQQPPTGAQSAMLSLHTVKSAAGSAFTAFWDDLFVVAPEPPAALGGGVALAAIALLTRRTGRRARPPRASTR